MHVSFNLTCLGSCGLTSGLRSDDPFSWIKLADKNLADCVKGAVTWSRGTALTGQKHAAGYETETQVSVFEDGKELTLSTASAAAEKAEVKNDEEEKGGWTIMVRTQALCDYLEPTNRVIIAVGTTSSAGDKILQHLGGI